MDASPLTITLHRAGDRLCWRVVNDSPAPVWALLLVPSIVDGRESFAIDTAWFEAEGERLIVRKIDTPIPADGRRTERVATGAIELAPGAARDGAITLGPELELGGPYERAPIRITLRERVREVVLEVGWLPVVPETPVVRAEWAGAPFAYLLAEVEAGGQRFVRSAPLSWT
jgi:hypothetical protein